LLQIEKQGIDVNDDDHESESHCSKEFVVNLHYIKQYDGYDGIQIL